MTNESPAGLQPHHCQGVQQAPAGVGAQKDTEPRQGVLPKVRQERGPIQREANRPVISSSAQVQGWVHQISSND